MNSSALATGANSGADGRRCALHPGDFIVAVFGNRYATLQFEGHARTNGRAVRVCLAFSQPLNIGTHFLPSSEPVNARTDWQRRTLTEPSVTANTKPLADSAFC